MGHPEHRSCKDVRMLHREKLPMRQCNSRTIKQVALETKLTATFKDKASGCKISKLCLFALKAVLTTLPNIWAKPSWLYIITTLKEITMFSVWGYLPFLKSHKKTAPVSSSFTHRSKMLISFNWNENKKFLCIFFQTSAIPFSKSRLIPQLLLSFFFPLPP